jgi:hypothetical protein
MKVVIESSSHSVADGTMLGTWYLQRHTILTLPEIMVGEGIWKNLH